MDTTMRSLEIKLVAVYILNLFDAAITYFGVAKDFITEGNPLLGSIVANPVYLVLLKGMAIPVALVLLYQLCRKTKSYRLLRNGANILLGAYGAVFLAHAYWLVRALLT